MKLEKISGLCGLVVVETKGRTGYPQGKGNKGIYIEIGYGIFSNFNIDAFVSDIVFFHKFSDGPYYEGRTGKMQEFFKIGWLIIE